MTWTKIGDEFLPASMDLSDAAFRLHVESLTYSNWRLLDLMIPKRAIPRYSAVADADAAVVELVAEGWWQDCDEYWWIGCRFPDWQRDRATVEHRREQLALAQRRRRAHLVDDHRLCLNCSAKSTDDSPDDSSDDPGRDGYRSGQGSPQHRREEHRLCDKCLRTTTARQDGRGGWMCQECSPQLWMVTT